MLPDSPVFLIQQTFRGRSDLPPIATERANAGRTPPGLFMDFGAVHLRGVREASNNAGQLTPLVAGGAHYDTKTRTTPLAPWAGRAAPNSRSSWDSTVRECLDEQRNILTLDALCVPGAELSPAAYQNGIERQADAIRRAWAGRPASDPPWFAHFSLHDDWLTDDTLRRFALNLLTDLPDDVGVALQVRFARRDGASHTAALTGLREVVTVLANDRRRVLMVKTGALGLLSIGWGAWGFTAGTSQGSWLDSREVIRRRRGQPPPPRLDRYFEPQLLHHVLWSDHAVLAGQSGYSPCSCALCSQLATGYANRVAVQHDLYALTELTQQVARSDRAARRAAVLALVQAAERNWAAWGSATGLSPRARPVHLPTWQSLL